MNKTLFCFIVGVEKCGTTSLANFLVDNEMAYPLVPNIKEPNIFQKFRPITIQNIQKNIDSPHHLPLLDASVNAINCPHHLQMIDAKAKNYKIIVCLRNQYSRMISAYSFYKQFNSEKLNPHLISKVFTELDYKDIPQKNKYEDLSGHYFHSWLHNQHPTIYIGDFLDQFDKYVEEYLSTGYTKRVMQELRFFKKNGQFLPLSILNNSFYASKIDLLLKIVNPERVMIISESFCRNIDKNSATISEFLDVIPTSNYQLDSRNIGDNLNRPNDIEIKNVREFLANDFNKDSEELLSSLSKHKGVNLSLFDPNDLFFNN